MDGSTPPVGVRWGKIILFGSYYGAKVGDYKKKMIIF